jgi:MFS family permease
MLSHSSTGVAVVDVQEDLLRASAMANETPAPDITRLPIRRNVVLLSAAVAANASTLQLTSAVASISLARLLDVEGLLGLGPALVLAAGALAAVPAGRAMDRRGRIPVLAAGFALGAASCGLAALGSADCSPVAVVAGLIGLGVANGPARLIRIAGGDMYPPERRARGIALVLFGAVFGGILGPAVFGPLLAGRELDGDTLAVLWLAGGALQLAALALAAAVRPDPKAIASLLGHESPAPARPVAPLRDLLRCPGVASALVAAQMSVGVMVGVMSLTGPVIVDYFHHEPHEVFAIIGAQLLGMYALVIVVGGLVVRIGRAQSLAGGLLLMGLTVSSLLWLQSVPATAAALFGLGLGWNISYVAATAELTERTQSWERGRLLGFNDLLSGAMAAGLTLLGGLALAAAGVAALALGAMALVVVPALWIVGAGSVRRRVYDTSDYPGRTPCTPTSP